MIKNSYYQPRAGLINEKKVALDDTLFKMMLELFTQIGVFWKNTPEHTSLRTDLYGFMINRISLDPNYLTEYENAAHVLTLFKQEYSTIEKAYAAFFTDPEGLESPPKSIRAYARQTVSNEFISFQLSIGGFKSFGAKNYPGYIGGAYQQGKPAPYRTK
jgi:hypothetical protein